MSELTIDFETRSTVDLRKTGVYVYSESPTTSIWCAAWAIDDGPVEMWTPGQPCPDVVRRHVESGGIIRAFNANFERILWRDVLAPRHGWPLPKLEQWRCTMVSCLAQSLPGSLANAASALGVEIGKDMDGNALMMRMAKPRRPRKGELPNQIYWWDDEERQQRLQEYCRRDVEVEREIARRVLPLRPSEQNLWFFDCRVNDRGVYVDTALCDAAVKIVEQAATWLDREMSDITKGFVSACSNVGQIGEYLRTYGGLPDVTSIAKGEIDELLARRDLSPACRRVLELRREAAKASVAKIDALLNGRSADGCARGLYQFTQAGTGRWAGRRFQPQNLKTPELEDVESAIEAVSTGDARLVQMLYGNPLSVVGDCIRGMVRARLGKKLIAADLISIEGVVLPWLAGEQWKLDAFTDYISGRAPDLYIQGYCKAFHCAVFAKNDPRRKFGKVMELASGFQGGHGAYIRMGATGDVLARLVEIVRGSASADEWEGAEDKFRPANNHGLTMAEWTALRIAIDRWRGAHPAIEDMWRDYEAGALEAIDSRGKVVYCGKIAFRVAGSFLYMRLPSGRCLSYPYPKIVHKMTPWGKKKETAAYKGVDTYTRQWTDCYAYGGLWAENATQAAARDVLAEGMLRLEGEGYPIVMHTHDEAVTEVDPEFGSVEEVERLMSVRPKWALDLPVAASGWSGGRYRK